MNNEKNFSNLESLFKVIERGEKEISISGVQNSSKAYIIGQIYKWLSIKKNKKHVVLITTDMKAVRNFFDDLSFFCGSDEVNIFPGLSSIRHDVFNSEIHSISQRNSILAKIDKDIFITVAPVVSFLQKTLSKERFSECSFKIEKGKYYLREELIDKLTQIGYTRSPITQSIGEFTVRGGLFDIFTPCENQPVRIDFFGNEVESLRFYDSETQITINKTSPKKITIVPVREILFSESNINRAKVNFKNFGDKNNIPKSDRDRFIHDIENKIYFSGIDYLLPFFEQNLTGPASYFPEGTIFFIDDSLALEDRAQKYFDDEKKRYNECLEEHNICSEYVSSNLNINELFSQLKKKLFFDTLELENLNRERIYFQISSNSDLVSDMKNARTSPISLLDPLIQRIEKWNKNNFKLNFVSRTRSQGERLKALLEERSLFFNIKENSTFNDNDRNTIYIEKLSSGFKFITQQIVLITEEELFGERKHIAVKKSKVTEDAFFSNFSELKPNDYIVHVDHGIGIYRGLSRMGNEDNEGDFITLEYKDGDKLYIPVYRLNVIQKHSGGQLTAVDKLGGTKWQLTKSRTKKSLYSIASELLKIYAAREQKEGFSFLPPDNLYKEFEATFPFEETEDQLSSVNDIISDMISPKVMDRLVCGDVGYGKTEVAIRAAFIAVSSSKQVAVLVPTTLLADQHFRTFCSRLKDFSTNIEVLSRFKTKKSIKNTLNLVSQGKVDILIGTHRLLSEDVKFKNIGLLIIDEEQRFGVKHKEKLKNYRALVDVLTLTATPIPRTLNLSLMGVRDISIINTPPVDRLSIRTYVSKFNDNLIVETVTREIQRGGQVFFLHNRVQTIGAMAQHLKEILPNFKIAISHGQMKERDLENVMFDFINKKYDILVTSTIIENGIDISSANTMIVNRADTFGLSQLYQLRGRVGRSKERAYCYFLIPHDKNITEDAKRRLQVIKDYSNLGAGFHIASHDLEIRGGGNILGREQSGHIEEIGFDLYMKLLQEAILEIKGEEIEKKIDPEININIPAFIPSKYIDNEGLKLVTYKRISSAISEDELDKIEEELRDRFGPLPEEVHGLLWIMAIKILLSSLNVVRIKAGNGKLVLTFDQDNPDIKPESLVYLMTHLPKKYSITPDYKLIIILNKEEPLAILHEIRNLIKLLAQ